MEGATLNNAIVKEKPGKMECKGCAKNQLENTMDHEQFLQMMLEKEKQKILKKLRLKEPPKITGNVANEALPGPLVDGDLVLHTHSSQRHTADFDLEDLGNTEQVIVFPDAGELLYFFMKQ